jgi:ubiquinone/menaquinone biosynthesis C-methylase UbiE
MDDNNASDTSASQLSKDTRKNRDRWNASSDEYERHHARVLTEEQGMAWGNWRIPETELRVLGEVVEKDILEFGCGAARWSIALAQRGARPVGLDVSSRQLQHAQRLMSEAGVSFPLIEASAEHVPLPDASFDTVFCDWGAMTFCDPYRTVPEASRLLRAGGLFAFMTASPISVLCQDRQTGQISQTLLNNYFGMHRLEQDNEVDFQLPYGEWIHLFRRNGFIVEDLLETQPAVDATSVYLTAAQTAWARRFPWENLWKLRKEK